jgi:hypothetical protein
VRFTPPDAAINPERLFHERHHALLRFTGRLLIGGIFLMSSLSKIPAYAGITATISGADLHWAVADREAHEKVGFHQGWPMCTEQLAILVATL